MNNTLIRALSGSVYVALLLIATSYSSNSLIILFGIFLLLGTIEFCKLIHFDYVFPVIITLTCYTLFNLNQTNKTNDILMLSATLFVSIKAILFLFDNKNKPLDKLSKYIYVIGYIALPFVIITKIPFGIRGYNPKILISIFILIWINDTFAFLVGKSIGKHKLFEKVSPKKTIEGFVGGLVFCIIGSFLVAKYYIEANPKNIYIWIIIAAIVSIFGTIGDLIESKFKRIAGVKDSGNIMPGHGGILDRLDSIIFVAPFVFLFYQILYYVS
ncbi:phosphatidate cytidylyltransferase [Flavobacterium capsici]|uniref:Phosphatidate cytidylyltransferase n=1 Tax=Flavobacterium capsici TaxID=3075618 RepID=A0AA96J8T9_9FLAO|nr:MULTISPECIES: phosphatidate cytidylyltransferase [unclassified Flavobacterium]WNM18720.1 phosphatidate cytidylyltransferase [Flavobacterium sp. PMR2A8]WNM22771.1 phosphatidate cytidylyltransferase [Flavobacterium sp. PMTSA4]